MRAIAQHLGQLHEESLWFRQQTGGGDDTRPNSGENTGLENWHAKRVAPGNESQDDEHDISQHCCAVAIQSNVA